VFNVNHAQAATHVAKAAALTYNECESYKQYKVKRSTAHLNTSYRHGENSCYRLVKSKKAMWAPNQKRPGKRNDYTFVEAKIKKKTARYLKA
jgi:hypothetical protein